MFICNKKYDNYSDKQIIETLIKTPVEENFHKYFFYNRCAPILSFVSTSILHTDNKFDIVGEVYEFLSDNDWQILRNFAGKEDATLNTYLSSCIVNHFKTIRKREYNRTKAEVRLDIPDIYTELTKRSEEKDESDIRGAAMQAYQLLEKKDQVVIKALVIDKKSALEAADEIWPHVCSDASWQDLPRKRVQDTIAMRKRRATLILNVNLLKILKRENN